MAKTKTVQELRSDATDKSKALPKVLKSFVDIEEKIEGKVTLLKIQIINCGNLKKQSHWLLNILRHNLD